jgi:hypothetical protein
MVQSRLLILAQRVTGLAADEITYAATHAMLA